MRFRSHLVFGIFLYFVSDFYFEFNDKIILFLLFLVMSIFADIDIHTSFIGHKFKIVSYFTEFIFQHRGIMHSLWVAVVFYLLLKPLGYGIAVIGYIGHLFLDALNKQGVRLFWPFFRVRGVFACGKIVDAIIFIIFLGLDLFFITTWV